jgi:hypothetical protein
MLRTDLSHLFVVRPMQSVFVFLLSLLLLLLLNSLRSQILLEFTLLYSVLVFSVLKSNLSFFLQISELVGVLEHQMH